MNKVITNLGKTLKTTSPIPPKEGLEKQRPGYLTANPISYNLIKVIREYLKKNPPEAEIKIWEYLRNKKTGHKIRRQHIIDNFIADFVCLPKKVVIEIDGKIHQYRKEYDKMRTERFNELEYTVIRFSNDEVIQNPESVYSKIKKILDGKDIIVSPLLEGPGEVI